MAETTVEKATCGSCGADVRDETAFCYNCGKSLTAPVPVASSGVNGMADEALPIGKPESEMPRDLVSLPEPGKGSSQDRLAIAAEKRKKARLSQRKPRQLVWVSAEESSNTKYVLVTLLIAVIAAAVVFLTVYLK